MTKEQLNSILENASKTNFVETVEYLLSHEKEYKQSKLYKQIRVSLVQLYREYLFWKQANRNVAEDFVNEFKKIDKADVVKQISELADYLLENQELGEKIMEVLDRFDLRNLAAYAEDLQEVISKFKD